MNILRRYYNFIFSTHEDVCVVACVESLLSGLGVWQYVASTPLVLTSALKVTGSSESFALMHDYYEADDCSLL